MKTEITIDGITYKVGDVLERYGHNDHEILFIGDNAFFTSMKSQIKAPDLNYIVCFSDLASYKIKKPKKKIVIERWLNVYSNGDTSLYKCKTMADGDSSHYITSRVACEYVKFEYEIDE
jgi:hypothetical protein